MTDTPPPTPDSTPPAATPPAPPKRRRWWTWPLRVAVVGVVLLVLLIALLPTIAGLSPVRSFALGKAQAFVPHGKLDVASYSLGWFSPIRLSGVRLYDDRGNVILEADDVHTDLTLLQAVRQKFNLTNTVVDAAAHLIVYPDGHTNLQQALGQYDAKPLSPQSPPPSHEPHPDRPPAPTKTTLPNVTADITLKLRGDVRLVDQTEATVAQIRLLPGSGGVVRIPDINQPITTDLQFQYDTGDATKPGAIALKSSVDAVENNTLDLANVAATIDMPVRDVDLVGFKPFLAMAGQKDLRLAGVLAGGINGELKPGRPGEIRSTLAVADFEASAPQLKDTIKAATLDLPLRIARSVVNGVSRLALDGGVTLPQLSVRLTGDLPEPALLKLADKGMPGDHGALTVAVVADLKKLFASMPNTLRLLPGLTVSDGTFHTSVTATLNPADVQTHVKTDLFLRGTKDGQIVSVDPVTLTADATATDLSHLVPGLRDLAVSMTSAFANFTAGGKSLAVMQGKGSADLDQARRQLAQVVDLGKLQLAGAATFSLASAADPKDATVLRTQLRADVQRLKLGLPDQPVLDLPYASTSATAELVTDANGLSVKQIRTATASVLAGDGPGAPTFEAALAASELDVASQRLGELVVSKCAVPSLSKLQTLLDPFVPALKAQKIQLAAGSANVVLTAKDIDLMKRAATLTQCEAVLLKAKIERDGRGLLNDTIRFNTAGTVAAGDALRIDLSQLSLRSDLAKVEKSAGPFRLQKQGDAFAGGGTLAVSGDVKKLLAVVAAFQQATAPMPYGGQLQMTSTFSADKTGIGLKGNGTVDGFVIYGDDNKPTFAESQVRFANDVSVDTAAASADIRSLTLEMASSKAATIDVKGAVDDYVKERRLKGVAVTVTAVGEKLLPILMAVMPEAQKQQFEGAKLSGPIQVKLIADGSYPVRPTWNESVKTVVAYGDVSMKSLGTMGLDVSDVAALITLKDGKLITGDTRKRGAARFAKPFTVNGGSGDIGSITLDVSDPELRLSIGRKQKVLQKVQLNPVLASQLGSIASVLFKDSDKASGLIDLVVQDCQNVPLLDLMNKKATASFVYSVKDLDVRGVVPSALSSALGWGSGGIQGDIANATLALKNGKADQDMTLALARQMKVKNEDNERVTKDVTETMTFKGGVDLATNRFDGYHMTLSQGLLLKDIRGSFPNGATIELKGKVNDIGGALTKGIVELGATKAGERALDQILGGLNRKKKEK